MGKTSTPKTEVTEYFMSQHFGVCIGPVTMLAITIKEKSAWTGELSTQSQFVIHNDGLFGDTKKEGGVRGVVHYLPGADDQILYDELAVKLGRADGTDCPGYRGLASVFFTGQLGISGVPVFEPTPRKGFLWGANTPYLPPVWITVRRAPVGLNPDYALVSGAPGIITGEVELTWWQCSFEQTGDNDEGRMGVAFLDSGAAQIGATTWSPFAAPIPFQERTLNAGSCPAGTSIIRISMEGLKNSGVNCDSNFDDIEVTLDGVPLPITNPGAESGDLTGWTVNGNWSVRLVDPLPHTGTGYFHGGRSTHPVMFQDISTAPTGADANPAHIIFECLTNTDWGMGSPETAIDKAGFEAVAITLFAEGFGLSMLWVRQSSIQDFIQEVLDHIQAVLFVDPATGLLTLKLIRGDYDVAGLPEINPDNAVLTNFSRKLWGEITNEIVVTWTNPVNEQEETVTVQDLASVVTQGGIVSDSRNYYGVRNALLASKLAQRDLRSAGAPLATFEAEVDRTLWEARPASVVSTVWPEYGLDGVICRVTSVDYGKPGDPTVKLAMVEDVFGLDAGAYQEPPSSGWIDPSEPPEPLTIEQIITLPLFFAANSPVADFVDSPEYPEVVAGFLATTGQTDAYGYDLWDEVTLSNGSLEWQQVKSELNIIGHAELVGALVAEATSTGVTFASFIGDTGPVVSGFVIIGDEGDEGNEIAQIDAISTDYTLRRGVLDTVPRAWPAATPVWFLDESTVFEDPRVQAAGDTLDVKLLTRTSQGILDIDDAALVSQLLSDRPWLPNRPAKVEVAGVRFNTVNQPVDMIARVDPWVTISWANRNRLLEDSQVLEWTDATMTPETGQTTGIRVIAEDGTTVLDTITGIGGTTHDVPDASFGLEAVVLIQPFGERSDGDGDFVSLQAHGVWVQVALGEPITEAGEGILVEDDTELIFED